MVNYSTKKEVEKGNTSISANHASFAVFFAHRCVGVLDGHQPVGVFRCSEQKSFAKLTTFSVG